MNSPTSDIAFTPNVKALQDRFGSRASYAKMEEKGGFRQEITEDLVAFLNERDSFYLATATQDGQPCIQHRGGPKGFLRVIDKYTLAFGDFRGNRQYISYGNLQENDKVSLFLMDYVNRRRIKVWGTAKVVEDDPAAFVSDGTVMIALWQVLTDEAAAFDCCASIGLHHLALMVEGEETLSQLNEKLGRADGVTVEFPSEPLMGGPTQHMMCTEPGGIRIEFIAPAQ